MRKMTVPTAVLLIVTVFFVQTTQGCPCSTPESDIYKLRFGLKDFQVGQTPILKTTGDVFPFLHGVDGPVSAARHYGCGKVAVVMSQEAFMTLFRATAPIILNIFNWLSSSGGKHVGVLEIHETEKISLGILLSGTCYNLTTTIPEPKKDNLDPYDILLVQTSTNLTGKTVKAIVDAVRAGKSLVIQTRESERQRNNLAEMFGVNVTETITFINETFLPSRPQNISECIQTQANFHTYQPANMSL
jgi:hypothetical protein